MPFGLGKSTPSDDVPISDEAQVDDGKGRPTPKRAEARQARRNPSPGGSSSRGGSGGASRGASSGASSGASKAAANTQRQRNREERARAYAALRGGDERFLPPRDAGPERRLVRDVVDSRFTLGQVFLVVIVLSFACGLIAIRAVNVIANYAGLVSLVIIVIDCARHARAAKAAVQERFPNSPIRGISSYAFLRAMLPRRFRRPPPKVGRGGVAL